MSGTDARGTRFGLSRLEEENQSHECVCELSTTLPTRQDAERVAELVIQQKLAACVQISSPIRSHYFWNGSVHADEEYALRIKTTADAIDPLMHFLKSQHPYELPEFTWQIVNASAEYAAWVTQNVKRETRN